MSYQKQEDVQAVGGNDIAIMSWQSDPIDTLLSKEENKVWKCGIKSIIN